MRTGGIVLFYVDGGGPSSAILHGDVHLPPGWYYQAMAPVNLADALLQGPFDICEKAFEDAKSRFGWK